MARRRFRGGRALAAALAAALWLGPLAAVGPPSEVLPLGRFGPPGPDGLPEGWKELRFRAVPVPTRYALVPEGAGFALRAESHGGASALYRPLDADPRVHRRLGWRWKVENVVAGADARSRAGDDYAARVYVAFAYDPGAATAWERVTFGTYRAIYGEYPPSRVINYVWDNRLAPGTILDNAYTARAKMIVVESGAERVGQWRAEERDVYADYRQAFGKEPPRIAAVAVMTDTDDTGEHAVAYYDSVVLRPAP